ncbi:MAG: Hpt domain-containing protein [Burkholderiales bacterium]|nr:Hpt domain-containing protein [Burkholderiales bacterium]
MKDLADTGTGLNSPSLSKLLRELSGIARHVSHSADGSKLGLELATSLLFVENALDQISRLPAHFSERAEEITTRLLAVVSGDEPQTQAAWIGEISREAQQRQTMGVLVSEMQSSLRQIEKTLDEYFREPENKTSLNSVDGILHQIGGALAVLDQDDAMRAVEHTRQMVAKFANDTNADSTPESQEKIQLEQHNVAQNIGALSFFIETLQSQPELAKKKFSFDADTGLFRSNLLEVTTGKVLLPSGDVVATARGSDDLSIENVPEFHSAEQELSHQQQESARLAASLAAAPESLELASQLKDSLESERSVAHLLDDVKASDRAKAAIQLLDSPDFSASSKAMHEIVAATAPISNASAKVQSAVLPQSDEAIDAELLEIFLTEADEVLEFVQKTLPVSRAEPDNQEYLTSLRRSFHTLKGSSRMVGLNVFGETAWSIEQVMNLWLSDSRDGNENLYELLTHTATEMVAWVNELKQFGHSSRTGADIVAAAERVKAGNDFELTGTSVAESPVAVEEDSNAFVNTEALAAPGSIAEPEIQAMPLEATDIVVNETTDIASETAAPMQSTESTADELLPMADWDLSVAPMQVVEEKSAPETVQTIDSEANAIELIPPFELSDFDELPAAEPVVTEPEIQAVSLTPEFDLEFEESTADVQESAATHVDHEPEQIASGISVVDEIAVEPAVVAAPVTTELLAEIAPEFTSETLPEATLELTPEPTAEVAPELILESEQLPEALPEATAVMEAESMEVGEHADATILAHEPEPEIVADGGQEIIATTVAEESVSAEIFDFPDLSKPVLPALDDNIKRIGNVEISLPLYSIYMAETDEIVRFLAQDFAEWRHEPHRHVTTHAIHATHTLAGSSATVGLKPLQELAHSLELVLQRLERHPVSLLADEYDVLDHALETGKRMLQKFALSEMAASAPAEVRQLEQLLQAVIGRSSAGADEEFITSTNEKLDLSDLSEIAATDMDVDMAPSAVPELGEDFSDDQAISASAVATANAGGPTDVPPANAEQIAPSADHQQINDELDLDLLPVFIEEGNDLLPMVGQLLRSWQEQPEDDAIPQSIARLMHTIKGSARMAGAMGLGQHIHDMETRIESLMHVGGAVRQPLLEDLLARHDHSMQLFDRLQNPDAHVAPLADIPLTAAQELDRFQESLAAAPAESTTEKSTLPDLMPVMPVFDATATTARAALAPATPMAPAAPVTLVRVRADILDRLVNQAGEVSISRSRLENEVGTLRTSLTELTENVNRLRDQLREVEIQAETQITSRMAHSADREFDPLEFDRFTRLQELTRMMAESVSDVATVQTNLTRTIDGATNDLHMQARLTRELQQDLMRVRMIPFASISERLYRVTRQTSKEVDKRVNLDIRGATVEMDRGVLEKMVGPFEHLLRNAIVHGIEAREQRRAQGKEETGEMLIEVRQEGNEVVIRFSDDGRGLDLARIRDKAHAVGLIANDEQPGDLEVANMIFEPGFSTAAEITELAGRGVGMDVVRSEAASLGGRVEVHTVEGKGAEFIIRLPLTLAVTQVVLLSAGGRTFAVPSVLVEQVQQLKTNALVSAYNEGAVMWQGQRVPMHYLATMLGQYDVAPLTQQYTPLLIMKSGTERLALHVDDILGNREVVVKNIGPQLARMTGISGATVLGSGEIVLILNPVPLAHRMEHEHARLPAKGEDATTEMGAVADLQTTTGNDKANSEPVQGLRTQHTVMVVDDSLTVRRVTQRLLTREGYQVILAKDGIDALEQLQSVTPDVMLVDIEMPRMDGFDLTRNVRSDARTSHIPIIMITSRTADKHRNYAKELGVNEYFGKPYREDDLLEAIVGFIGKDQAVIV